MKFVEAFKSHWKIYLILALLILNAFIWQAVYAGRQSDLTVSFLDVGQGDAILIESPSGGRVLIDGGPSRKVLSELGKALPFGDSRIDAVVATHPDTDHIGGLAFVLDRYDVDAFVYSGKRAENNAGASIKKSLEEKGIPLLQARRGMIMDLGGGALVTILFPNQDVSRLESNDASIVARLDFKDESFLLTGDAERRTENILLGINAGELDTDVLKVGHHGSRTSSSQSFLDAVTPEYAVISAGKNNRYGHPHPEVIKRLKNLGSKILNTAEEGTIVFETDGEILKVK